MPDLTPELAAEVIAACEAGAEEAAGALSRTFDAELTLAVGEAATFDPAAPPEGLDGPGLALLLKFGDAGLVAVLPGASGLLPEWLAAPDATGESKLATLAQELGMLLVPETLMADDFQAAWVDDLAAAVERAVLPDGAAMAPLTLAAGESWGDLTLLWPAASPDKFFGVETAPKPDGTSTNKEPPAEKPPEAAESAQATPPRQRPIITDLSQLPKFSRSLLKVELPVNVCLATKKQTIQEIVELGPGAIIMFDKSCDDPVHLNVVEETVATGEVVKVGEKFGMRIDAMVLPEEAFKRVRGYAG